MCFRDGHVFIMDCFWDIVYIRYSFYISKSKNCFRAQNFSKLCDDSFVASILHEGTCFRFVNVENHVVDFMYSYSLLKFRFLCFTYFNFPFLLANFLYV